MDPPELFYRIVSAGMERMTLCNPHDRHPDRFRDALFIEGFNSVLGTGRDEPAGRREER